MRKWFNPEALHWLEPEVWFIWVLGWGGAIAFGKFLLAMVVALAGLSLVLRLRKKARGHGSEVSGRAENSCLAPFRRGCRRAWQRRGFPVAGYFHFAHTTRFDKHLLWPLNHMTFGISRTTKRTVAIGGCAREELLQRLQAADVQLNDFAKALFSYPRFVTLMEPTQLQTVELAVADPGLPEGGTFPEIMREAMALGLSHCPLELGPNLRLQLLDQPEGFTGQPPSKNRDPPGSVTIVSPPLVDDDDFPKGFYFRRIERVPWLRGYRSWDGHSWSPEDRLIFAVPDCAA